MQTSVTPPDARTIQTQFIPPLPEGDALKGRILGGRYQLDTCIGSGGMGAIYKARRLHIGDTVAVKVLKPEVVDDTLSRERFHREARAAAMLNHPNAVVIHDFGEDEDGTAYIVMEFLEGHSLRQILSAERTIAPARMYGIIRQACAALEAAHERGIIHRDIKPDNIILTNTTALTDHVKILDFGIAKLRDKAVDTASLEKSLTTVGTVIGTPHYMSPEQCQGEPADARSDIYSLGIVVYEMLVGAVPFTAKTPTGVAVKHVTEMPRPITAIRPELPATLEKVVMRALAKEPAERQQSALELAAEIATAVQPGMNPGTGYTAIPESGMAAQTGQTRVPTGNFSQSLETSVSPSINNRSFETQVAPVSTTRGSRPLPVITIVAGILLVAVAAAGIWWYIGARQTEIVKPTPAPTVVPTPAPSVEPSPSVPAVPTPPEGMAYIPGGEFRMGRDDGDEFEKPSYPVTVAPFFMDITEVANEAYQKFLEANNYLPPPSWQDGKFPVGEEKFPVTDVSWEDATAYATWAGKRLPTEEEWEFAARGTDNRLYPWGLDARPEMANVGKTELAPVGSFPRGASPFGVLDLSGNAWEWTTSEIKAYPGGTLPAAQEGYNNLKVIRGGSFVVPGDKATVTLRRGWPGTRQDWPASVSPDYAQTSFRCAQDVKP